ncbi:exodeoxyribonuclease V gamma chain [Haemophilus influenzae 22.1-21]|nr:exodeoxyribonuclease V gamma chain [Haemophilus influenzae 22.1-21]
MDALFGDNSQVIHWHFAKYKDRYCIRPWIYYLIQCVTQENAVPAKLITQDKVLELPPIEREVALAQLQIYVKDYLQSQIEIQLVPTIRNINDFIVDDESAVDFDNVFEKLQALTESNGFGSKADPYWSRVLAQTSRFKQPENIAKLLKTNKSLVWLIIRTKEDKKGTKLIVK